MTNPRFLTISAMILAAALSRLVPHPWNMTPVAAIALFSGAHFERRSVAFLAPLLALFVSDLFLGFHRTLPFVYVSFAISVGIGMLLKRRSVAALAMGAVASSFLFFFITNFGYWLLTPAFSKTLAGLGQCYAVAIPFFRHTLAGDLLYTALLFGGFALAEKTVPALKRPEVFS